MVHLHALSSDSELASLLRVSFALRNEATRTEKHLFLVEGLRELSAALSSNWPIRAVFRCEKVYKGRLDEQLARSEVPVHAIRAKDFARLAYREESGGVIGVAEMRHLSLSDVSRSTRTLVLILNQIEKPGNLGAIFRTAAAAGIEAVLLCGGSDPTHPNVVRNSLGAVFEVPWVRATEKEVDAWTKAHNLQVLGLDPHGVRRYDEADLRAPTAIVVGAEATGLSTYWKQRADELLHVPLASSSINSLNVASVAAIISYEALRQRRLNG